MRRFIRSHATRLLDGLAGSLDRVVVSPRDARTIHDLRVALRRFVQCLRLFAGCFDSGRVPDLRRRLRKLMNHCGAVRDCDVALQVLDAAGVRAPALRKHLRQQRHTAQQDLLEHSQKWQSERTWKRWRAHLTVSSSPADGWGLRQTPAENARRALPVMAQEWLAAGDAAAIPGSGAEALHKFRLLGKRFRYTLELFTEVCGPALNKHLAELRSIQDQLGAINDCVASLRLMHGHPRAQAAVAAMLLVREQTFRAHWARHRKGELEQWKSTFLDMVRPSQGSKASPTPTASSPPKASATSAMSSPSPAKRRQPRR